MEIIETLGGGTCLDFFEGFVHMHWQGWKLCIFGDTGSEPKNLGAKKKKKWREEKGEKKKDTGRMKIRFFSLKPSHIGKSDVVA